MRVLILSSSIGGGHSAVAAALRELFEAHGDVCDVEDCLSFISEDVAEAVSRTHNFIYRHTPKLFDSGYRHTKRHPETFMKHHNGRRVLNLGKKNLGLLIRQNRYDAAICSHVFGAIMLTDARRKYGLTIPTALVETDYTVTPGAQACDVDRHFIPFETLRGDFEAAGMAPEKLVVSGIPVRGMFYEPTDLAASKARLGLDPGGRHILVMGGSMGAGPVPELAAELADQLKDGETVSIVCGTNQALEETLLSAYGDDARFRIMGYTDGVPELMNAADALVTKPGGITVTEAAVMRLPMILVNAVAGCEAFNMAFFEKAGGAVTADSPRALARLSVSIMRDDAWRGEMARALSSVAAVNDREIIWKTMQDIL